jgi:hypothetical protein
MLVLALTAGSMFVLTLQLSRLEDPAQRLVREAITRPATAAAAVGVDPLGGDGDEPSPPEPQLIAPTYDVHRRAAMPSDTSGTFLQLGKRIVQENKPLLDTAVQRPGSITLVSGLWDIGRGSMPTASQWIGQRRPFSHYVRGLKQFLAYKMPKVLFMDDASYVEAKPLIAEALRDGGGPTKVIIRSVQQVRADFLHGEKVDAIRSHRDWLEQSASVANSPQALLSNFAPVVMSKLTFLRDASRWNPFSTEGFLWLDGALRVQSSSASRLISTIHHPSPTIALHSSLFTLHTSLT